MRFLAQAKLWMLDRWLIKQPRLRRAITKAVIGNRDVAVRLGGVDLTINTQRENGYLRAVRFAKHSSLFRDELPVMLALATFVPTCDGFIDIGANIGLYSSVFAKLGSLHRDFHVYAFEADPLTYQRLLINAQVHKFSPFNVALASNNDHLSFVRGAVSHVTTTLHKANAYSIRDDTFSVDCRPLSSFTINGRRLMVKIDVEGQEYDVLVGATSLFQENRISLVYVDGYDSDRRVLEFLKQYGFSFRDAASLKVTDGDHFALLAIKS